MTPEGNMRITFISRSYYSSIGKSCNFIVRSAVELVELHYLVFGQKYLRNIHAICQLKSINNQFCILKISAQKIRNIILF